MRQVELERNRVVTGLQWLRESICIELAVNVQVLESSLGPMLTPRIVGAVSAPSVTTAPLVSATVLSVVVRIIPEACQLLAFDPDLNVLGI